MKITFFGAAGGVTGSKHLLEIGQQRVLLDCGFFQGRRSESYEANSKLPDKLKQVTNVILSHAHADHCCSLPLLVKNGYNQPIYTTPATADIARLIMLDAAKIQENDYRWLQKKGIKSPYPPIYSEYEVEKTAHLFHDVDYNTEYKINHQLSFKFYDAGHILGSAVTLIKTAKKNIIYTGDLGNIGLPILPDPEEVKEEAEVLICESTYGNRNHPPVDDAYKIIKEAIIATVKEKSRIIVPAFALGRTQEIIYILNKLHQNGEIPEIPIYVDSPLSNNITDVFKKYKVDFDEDTWDDFIHKGKSPFSFGKLNYVRTTGESKMLNNKLGPLMIIASSGMMEGGRVLHHLRNNISNPKTRILLTGFQAENTLGRKIENGDKIVKIYGEEFIVRAKILKLEELSAHADQNALVRYIESVKGLKKVFLVHGENEATTVLADLIKKRKPDLEIIIPKLGETFNL